MIIYQLSLLSGRKFTLKKHIHAVKTIVYDTSYTKLGVSHTIAFHAVLYIADIHCLTSLVIFTSETVLLYF